MDEIVKLDVGGHLYTTTRSTLTRYPDSMLGAMFSGRMPSRRDHNGAFVIDGDGPIFRYVLNFLRRGKLNLSTDFKDWDMLKSEANFYQIKELQDAVTKTTENTSMEFIEIVSYIDEYTYIGNLETLKQLPLLFEFLTRYRPPFGAAHDKSISTNIFNVVIRGPLSKEKVRREFNKLRVEIFHEISKLGFELKTSTDVFTSAHNELLRWTFARKMH